MKWVPSMMAGHTYKGSAIRLTVGLIAAVILLPALLVGVFILGEIHIVAPIAFLLTMMVVLLVVGWNTP